MGKIIKKFLSFLRRHIIISSITGVALAGVFIWLVFFYFAFHLYWVDDKVDEDKFALFDVSTEEPTGVAATAATTLPSVTTATTAEPTITTSAEEDTETTSPPVTSPPETSPPTTSPPVTTPTFIESAKSNFSGTPGHPTSGKAYLISDGRKIVLRFEPLNTVNGPDLNVYLAKSTRPGSDFVDLGDLDGNIGNQNYTVPPGTDLSTYDTVLIWCVRFSALFAHAELNQLPG